MRWLKTLVIGMGAVIVIGLTVVIVEVAQRAGGPSQPVAYSPMPPAPPVIGVSAPVSQPAPTRLLGDIIIAILASVGVAVLLIVFVFVVKTIILKKDEGPDEDS